MKSGLTVFITIFILLTSAHAWIIHVPADQPTVQAGIDAAADGDTVLVAENTYYENIRFKGKAITVASYYLLDGDTSHIAATVLDGSQSSHPDSGSVVYFINGEDTTSVLCGFTITGGSGTEIVGYNNTQYLVGGGICILNDSGGKIIHNNIEFNEINAVGKGSIGAGIFAASRIVIKTKATIIADNRIHANSAVSNTGGESGGILIGYGEYYVLNNTITHNTVTVSSTYKAVGGGIGYGSFLPTSHKVIIAGNIIAYNELHCAYTVGAGIYVLYSEQPGGAIIDADPQPLIYNNLITDNYAQNRGGGIGVWTIETAHQAGDQISPQPAIINNTIVNNDAALGVGIWSNHSHPMVMNSILWNDTAAGSEIILNDSEIDVFASNIRGGEWSGIAAGNFDIEPDFADPFFHLSAASSCNGLGWASVTIGGTVYYAPEEDFAGGPRPGAADLFVDIGAHESAYPCKVHPLSAATNGTFIHPQSDTLIFTADIGNPQQHSVQVYGKFTDLQTAVSDSMEMFDDGLHFDGQANDGLYGGFLHPLQAEAIFNTAVSIHDQSNGEYFNFKDNQYFTTIGPVTLDGVEDVTIVNEFVYFKLSFRNNGAVATALDVNALIVPTDTNIVHVFGNNPNIGDIAPGEVSYPQAFHIETQNNPAFVTIDLHIFSEGHFFWEDSVVIPLGAGTIQSGEIVPEAFALGQNYPNPFNPTTTIDFAIPYAGHVSLKVYNSLGEEVATLVSGILTAGEKQVMWDGKDRYGKEVSSGVYIYKIETGGYVASRKMLLIK